MIETVNVPSRRGVDKSEEGDFVSLYENPAGTFSGNTTLGKSLNGAWFAYISGSNTLADDIDPEQDGAYGYETPLFNAIDFHAFNITGSGVIAYHVTNLVFTDLAIVNDQTQWTSYFGNGAAGFNTVASYENINTLFERGIIENMATGMGSALGDASKPVVFQDTYDNDKWKYHYTYFTEGLLEGAVVGGTTVRQMKLKNWVNLVMATAAPRGYDHNTMLLDAVEFYQGHYETTYHPVPYSIDVSLDDGEAADYPLVPRRNIVTNFNHTGDAQLLAHVALLVKGGMTFFDESGDPLVYYDEGLDADVDLALDDEHDYQIVFGEQAGDYVIPQTVDTSLTSFTPQVVGQPGYRTSEIYPAKTNDQLWADYGLAAGGSLMPESGDLTKADYGFASSLSGNPGIHPHVFELPDAWDLPDDEDRLSLVTPWDGGEVIVPIGQPNVYMWIRPQLNGGLKTDPITGDATEVVRIYWTDVTPGASDSNTYFDDKMSKFLPVEPWHTFEITVAIKDLNDLSGPAITSRTATVTVVQPHITAVEFGYVNGGSPTNVQNVQLGPDINNQITQLKSLTGNVNTVSITFNQPMDFSSYAGVSMVRVTPTSATIAVTGVTSLGGNKYRFALASTLTAGQYLLHLSKDYEDTAGNRLSNGWSNPASISDPRGGISAVAVDGSIDDDFYLAVTILPNDTDYNNKDGTAPNEINYTAWPTTRVIDVILSDHTDSDPNHAVHVTFGSGQLDTVRLLTADTISIQFNQPMKQSGINALRETSLSIVLSESSLQYTASLGIATGFFDWDDGSNTASWRLDTVAGNILAWCHFRLAGSLVDAWGFALDSEWKDDDYTISGNGVAGHEIAGAGFDFSIIFLKWDLDDDQTVDGNELGILLNHFNQAGTYFDGDYDHSGTVDFTDLGILLNHYGIYLLP